MNAIYCRYISIWYDIRSATITTTITPLTFIVDGIEEDIHLLVEETDALAVRTRRVTMANMVLYYLVNAMNTYAGSSPPSIP
jgi:hypothetical protein